MSFQLLMWIAIVALGISLVWDIFDKITSEIDRFERDDEDDY